jgi:hypothetical protein
VRVRALAAALALGLAGCAPEPLAPVDDWVETGFALRLSEAASTTGEATAPLDLTGFRALSVGRTQVKVTALALEVLEFDPTTPTQLASGEVALAASAGAAAGFTVAFRDLPIGELGRKDVAVEGSAQDASALLLGKDGASLRLKYALDVVPARFKLKVRLKLRADEAP